MTRQNNTLIHSTNRLYHLAIALVVLSLTFHTQALPSDQEQDIYVYSESVDIDQAKGVSVYQGKVKIEQGSLKILADQVTVYTIDNQASKIIAIGKPAQFEQQPDVDKEIVVAQGSTIEYLVDQERLKLINNASLEQDGNLMEGHNIDYDMKSAVAKAQGGKDRVHMVIQPRKRKTADEVN